MKNNKDFLVSGEFENDGHKDTNHGDFAWDHHLTSPAQNNNFNLSQPNFNNQADQNSLNNIVPIANNQLEKMLNEELGWFRKIFPTRTDRLVTTLRNSQIQSAMDFRLKMFNLSTSYLLDGSREYMNSKLILIKSEYRERTSAFAIKKHDELQDVISASQCGFLEKLKLRYTFLDTLKDIPVAYNAYSAELTRSIAMQFSFLTELIERYQSLLREELKRY